MKKSAARPRFFYRAFVRGSPAQYTSGTIIDPGTGWRLYSS
jgi:hypothetical protein